MTRIRNSAPWVPDRAMVFAAGMGARMMPLTANCPKPMLHVHGQPLLSHALNLVESAGISNVVINTHYCAEVVHDYVAARHDRGRIMISHEETRLETGGGIKKAMDEGLLPKNRPVLMINSDILLTDPAGHMPAIHRLSLAWQRLGDAVDVLLLLVPRTAAWGQESNKGDYAVEGEDGRLRRISNSPAPFVYSGMMIARGEVYYAADYGRVFSNLKIMDAAQAQGRLYGVAHEGGWFHFSTPEALQRFNEEMAVA